MEKSHAPMIDLGPHSIQKSPARWFQTLYAKRAALPRAISPSL